jgi:hypothetical protein
MIDFVTVKDESLRNEKNIFSNAKVSLKTQKLSL